jgi:hypothetical protein
VGKAWNWRGLSIEAQGEWQDSFGYATRQDIQSLRKSLQYVLSGCARSECYNGTTNPRLVVPEMKLSPTLGSDRSFVWNTTADVSEGNPEAKTLAIRFLNSENASKFKEAFNNARQENEALIK